MKDAGYPEHWVRRVAEKLVRDVRGVGKTRADSILSIPPTVLPYQNRIDKTLREEGSRLGVGVVSLTAE